MLRARRVNDARQKASNLRAQHTEPVVGVQCAIEFVVGGRELVFSRQKKRNEDAAEMRFLLVRERRVCGRLINER